MFKLLSNWSQLQEKTYGSTGYVSIAAQRHLGDRAGGRACPDPRTSLRATPYTRDPFTVPPSVYIAAIQKNAEASKKVGARYPIT